jgi:GTPase SAR1 family protein
MDKYVIVIGDDKSGKSSLIQSICHPDQPLSKTPRVFTDKQQFSLENNQQQYTVNFIDTDKNSYTIQQHKQWYICDLVLFVMDCNNEEALLSLENQWLPVIQQAKKALFVVQTHIDKNNHYEDVDLHDVRTHILKIRYLLT